MYVMSIIPVPLYAQERQSRKQQQPMERLGCDVSYQNPEGTVPDEMNLGEPFCAIKSTFVWLKFSGIERSWGATLIYENPRILIFLHYLLLECECILSSDGYSCCTFLRFILIIIHYAEQFTSLLSLHPEYVLVFYECQHAGISSPPPSAMATSCASTNGNSKATPPAGLNGQGNGHNVMAHNLITLP